MSLPLEGLLLKEERELHVLPNEVVLVPVLRYSRTNGDSDGALYLLSGTVLFAAKSGQVM